MNQHVKTPVDHAEIFRPDDNHIMMSTRRSTTLNFTAPLVLEPPRHCELSSIALVPGRHLIGTAADCGIRLQVDGVLDRHALILVGENRTVVKSMDPRTWVNDGPVSEMALRPGDRLSIGPLTFRVRLATREEAAEFASVAPIETEPLARSIPEVPATERPVAAATTPSHDNHRASVVPPPLPVQTAPGIDVSETANVSSADRTSTRPVEPTQHPRSSHRKGTIVQGELERKVSVVPAREAASGPIPSAARDSARLDWRLNDIEQRLADLRQSTLLTTRPVEFGTANLGVFSHPDAQGLRDRDDELNRRAEQMATGERQLQGRIDTVTAREIEVDHRRQSLVAETDRIANVAESARRNLAEEHAQHVAIWEEWEASYQRMTDELARQLDAIDRQRESLQTDADRMTVGRAELLRVRAEHEQDRQACGAERAKLANERAELALLKSQHDARCRHQILETDDLKAQLESERRELDLCRTELKTSQQILERERQTFSSEWSTQLSRIEQENQRRTSSQLAIADERKRMLDERETLSTQQCELQRERSTFDQERSQFDVARIGAEEALRELQSLKDRCSELETKAFVLRQQPAVERSIIARVAQNEVQLDQSSTGSFAEATQESTSLPAVTSVDETLREVEPKSDAWSTKSSEDLTPPPIPSDPNSSVSFGVVSEWSTFSLVDHESGRSMGGSNLESIRESAGLSSPTDSFDFAAAALPSTNSPGWLESERTNPTRVSAASAVDPWGQLPVDFHSSSPAAQSQTVSPSGQSADPWGAHSRVGSQTSESFAAHAIENYTLEPSSAVAGSSEFEIDVHREAAANLESPYALSDHELPVEIAQNLNVSETLAEVNRQFGMPVNELPVQQASPNALPSWWVENSQAAPIPVDRSHESAHPSWVVEALRSDAKPPEESSQDVAAVPVSTAPPATDLRSQLAMLFDLPGSAAPVAASSDVAETAVPVERAVATMDKPVERTSAVFGASAPSHDSESHVEDSVESFMARLLVRSRTSADELNPPDSQPGAGPAVAPPIAERPVSDPNVEVDHQDRSHLMAGPKHKQDKQAVRENLQSFRQVAHLSARSALAKHSVRQLRNATIAKGVLQGAAVASTIWFLAEPLWGSSFQLWKAAGCAIAALLSGLEFARSWRQLYRPVISTIVPPRSSEVPVLKETQPLPAAEVVTQLNFTDDVATGLADSVKTPASSERS